MISDFEKMRSLKADRNKYCFELSLKFNAKNSVEKPLPSMFTEYGQCLEGGYQVAALPSKKEQIFLPDLKQALTMYKAAAQCNDPDAIKILKGKGEPVPSFSGREEGESFSPLSLSRDQDCGLSEHLTGWGYILTAPITIPVGAVLLVGAILTPVVCAVTSPFHSSKCM